MPRTAEVSRKTKETEIRLFVNLDGTGLVKVETGIPFFNHMLGAFFLHGGIDADLTVKGDLEVDCHHTVEDTGIVIGQAVLKAIGSSKAVKRFGTAHIPMDEALSRCCVDVSGRPYLVFSAEFKNQFIGNFDTGMVEEFMRALSVNMGLALHIANLYGQDDHHKAESMFKALAQALKKALSPSKKVLSTKGTL